MEFSRSLVLLVAAHAVHSVSGQSVTRCYNEMFDSLVCLPGTGISVQRINVYASTTGGPTGLCHSSRDNCTEQLPPNRDFPKRARAACDGGLTCDNLKADLDKVYCQVPDTRVDLSYITIQYTCETEQVEDFRYKFSCFNQTFDNFACDSGTVIDVTDVYVGLTNVTTGGCLMVPVGGCVHRFPDTVALAGLYRELCNGRVECGDARAYDRPGICGSTARNQYTMIVYQCVIPSSTTKPPPPTPPPTPTTTTTTSTTTTTTTTTTPTTTTPTTAAAKLTETATATTKTKQISFTSEVSATVISVGSNESSDLSTGTAATTVSTIDNVSGSDSTSTIIRSGEDHTTMATTSMTDTILGDVSTEIIIAVPVAVVCLVIGVVLVVCLIKRNKRQRGEQLDEPISQSNGLTTHTDAQNSSDGLYTLATNPDTTSAETPNSDIAPYSATMFTNRQSNNGLGPNKHSHRITLDMSDAPYTYDAPADERSPRKPSAVARGNVGAYDEVQLDAANVASASEPTGAIDGIQLETYPSGTRVDVNKVAMGTDDPGVTDDPANVYSEVVKSRRSAAKEAEDGQEDEDDTVIVDNALYG